MGDLASFFGALNPGDVGFAGLVIAACWLIFRGHLVPKSTVDTIKVESDLAVKRAEAAAERAVAEKKEWKEAYHLEHQARVLLSQQLGELTEYAETTERLIRSITAAGSGVGGQVP